MRIRICRKETKESCLWLRLSVTDDSEKLEENRKMLMNEAIELRKIFTSILEKSV